jgi:hypothetical protein
VNLPVVRALVEKQSLEKIQEAIGAFEIDRSNLLNVEGHDDGEKLSNLLVAEFVLKRLKKGITFPEAIREYSQRVRTLLKK